MVVYICFKYLLINRKLQIDISASADPAFTECALVSIMNRQFGSRRG